MLIKRLSFLCIFTVAATVFANDTDSCFDLKNYVPPAFNYHLLELKPAISFNGDEGDYHSSSYQRYYPRNIYTDELSSYSNSHPSMGLETRHKYYGWKGRTEWQISNEFSCNGSASSNNPISRDFLTHQDYSTTSSRNGMISGRTSIGAAYYFKWPYFFGGAIMPSVRSDNSRVKELSKYIDKTIDTSTTDIISQQYRYRDNSTIRKSYSAELSANCRAGAGHIDDVSFAIAALNILDIIARTETTYSGCCSQRVQNLASLIEKVRKRRVFDSRIAKIENIDTLCMQIVKMGIVTDITPRTVLEIADQLDYVFYQKRKSGFTIELCPTLNYQKENSNGQAVSSYIFKNNLPNSYKLTLDSSKEFTDNSSKLTYDFLIHTERIEYYGLLKARYELPVTRLIQFGCNVEISPSIIQTTMSDKTWEEHSYVHTSGTFPMVSAAETARFDYYPNTRTSITVSESVTYNRMFDYMHLSGSGYELYDVAAKKDLDHRNLSAVVKIHATYYFSPQLQIHANAGLEWSDDYRRSYGPLPRLYEKPSVYSNKGFRYQIGGNIAWGIF